MLQDLPLNIGHRGFKAQWPENSLAAFTAAVEAGAHALETDVHLTRDGVVVLSHDPSLERCFGVKKRVSECEWAEVAGLRTLQSPHERMMRLSDLLDYINQTDVWILLDIKVDDDAESLIAALTKTISSTPCLRGEWSTRITLGVWLDAYIPLCKTYMPSFPVALITFDLVYARELSATHKHLQFNMRQAVMMQPAGRRFLRDCRLNGRTVYVWTVNSPGLMGWCIRHGVSGVITDDPALYRSVCEGWDGRGLPVELREWLRICLVTWFVLCFGFLFKRRRAILENRAFNR
ncbi:hypothetical protein ASPZODRAFT_20105 [Penicilliopsis zonata CBS 506.65]|uniref:GP-PDE domain-containing protein n=1 Tax=Penicilliopsis zonata CBS 506.65 TaxID=1073090 RepID=A0A1L9S6P2_9EURO|nr:hypothetical protein ASPZODRAFT_20105 [Penicilliopsis zonata CBS 506.65]OJJ42829.1 hypothetical protein ASPZODRAFT_20105 [Penicilliopsis zonata CBS 506.65]